MFCSWRPVVTASYDPDDLAGAVPLHYQWNCTRAKAPFAPCFTPSQLLTYLGDVAAPVVPTTLLGDTTVAGGPGDYVFSLVVTKDTRTSAAQKVIVSTTTFQIPTVSSTSTCSALEYGVVDGAHSRRCPLKPRPRASSTRRKRCACSGRLRQVIPLCLRTRGLARPPIST